MAKKVAGDLYVSITGQLFEIGRQLRQRNGYPFDPELLQRYLQKGIEGKFSLFLTKPFCVSLFFEKRGWKIWEGSLGGNGLSGDEEVDARSLALTEVNLAPLFFETCLKDGEQRITGEEKLWRLKEKNFIRLSGNAFLGLWHNYEIAEEHSVLEYLYKTRKITYLDFFGLVLRDPDGYPSVLYLHRYDVGGWGWGHRWLINDWDTERQSVVIKI